MSVQRISERTSSPFDLFTPLSIDRLINSIETIHQDDEADRRDVETFLRRNR